MKKRLLALVTACVMTLSMGMTVFASESPVVDDTPSESSKQNYAYSATAVIDGNAVELDFTWHLFNLWAEATDAQKEQLDYYMPTDSVPAGDEEAKQRFKEKVNARTRELFEQVMGYRNEEVIYNDYFGLSLPSGYIMPAEGVEVTINAPYAGKGDYTYYIFHCKEDGTWEYIPTTEGNETLSGRFTSFSPVFIMRVPKADTTSTPDSTEPTEETEPTNPTSTVTETEPTNTASTVTETKTEPTNPTSTVTETKTEPTNTTSTVTAKAPKTGDFTGIYVAGMLTFFSAAGIAVYIRKQKEVR